MDKKTQRLILQKTRDNIKDRSIKSNIIYAYLKDLLSGYTNVASYVSFKSEVETQKINDWLIKTKNLILPKIEGHLKMYMIKDLGNLRKGTFNVLEPINCTSVDKKDIDCILVPLLAYNKDFYRMGYGRGYYDKFLKDYKGLRVGLAFEDQIYEDLLVEDHDEALDIIVTETKIKIKNRY